MTVDLTRTEILAQDDCSPDYNLMRTPMLPPVKAARNEVNLGFAGNVNAAAQRAKGDYLLLLNQDTRALADDDDDPVVRELLHPGWADDMLRVFLEHDNVGIVGPRLIFPTGNVQSVGGEFGADKGPWHRCLMWSDPLDRRCSVTRKVSWTTGAAIMIRREDFATLGGLRGDLYPGGYFEDVHLCMDMQKTLHKEVWYCAEASLVHEVGSTGGSIHFAENSRTFHALWDDFIEVDNPFIVVGF